MAVDTKISAQTQGYGLKPGDIVPVVRGGANYKATVGGMQPVAVNGRYRWIRPYPSLAAGTAIGTTGQLWFVPWIVPDTMTVTSLRCRVTTLQAAKLLAVGIYASSSSTLYPTGNVLRGTDWASQSVGATGLLTCTLTSSYQVTPGLYWVAYQADSTTAVFQTCPSSDTYVAWLIGGGDTDINNSATVAMQALSTANVFGSFPDVTAAGFTAVTSNQTIAWYFAPSSVP